MPITLNCPSCSHRLKVPDSAAGRRGKCPGCGAAVQIPAAPSPDPDAIPIGPVDTGGPHPTADDDAAPVAIGIKTDEDEEDDAPKPGWSPKLTRVPVQTPAGPLRVVVVDFDMSFGSMVGFMVKWAIASIPAAFILLVLAGFVSAVFVLAFRTLNNYANGG